MVKQLFGVWIVVFLILDLEVSVGDIVIENVLFIFGVGFQISGLDFFVDKFGVFWDQIVFEEFQIVFGLFLWELFVFNLLFQYIEQMYWVSGYFDVVEVKYLRQDFKGKVGGEFVYFFINFGVIVIFLIGFCFWVGIFQIFVVIDLYF